MVHLTVRAPAGAKSCLPGLGRNFSTGTSLLTLSTYCNDCRYQVPGTMATASLQYLPTIRTVRSRTGTSIWYGPTGKGLKVGLCPPGAVIAEATEAIY
jgi:hypothetical protein